MPFPGWMNAIPRVEWVRPGHRGRMPDAGSTQAALWPFGHCLVSWTDSWVTAATSRATRQPGQGMSGQGRALLEQSFMEGIMDVRPSDGTG